MADDVSLLRLIGRIYDAATDPRSLGELASDLSREFSCGMSLLYIVQNPRGKSTDLLLSATASFDDWAHASYTGYYRRRDVWSHRLLVREGMTTVHGLEVIDRSMLERSEIYNDYYAKVGIAHALAGRFPVAGDLGVVTINRARTDRTFDDADKARLGELLPHLQRAMQIQQRLGVAEQQSALSFDLLERLGLGIVVVERDCRVLFANSVARRLFRTVDALTTAHGCLRPSQLAQADKFGKLVRRAALTSVGEDTSPGGFIALRRAEGQLPVLVTPYRAPIGVDGHIHGAALVMFSDPHAHAIAPETAIAQMLGLSPAESRLVSAVVSGQTMADYADRVGISLNTVKTQMRQIFNKTGYNRQTDVIRAVLASPLVKFTEDGDATVAREAAE